jgi:hypothetical protein
MDVPSASASVSYPAVMKQRYRSRLPAALIDLAMNLNALHRRRMQDVLEIGNSLPLVITGGYAVQAHQLVDRLSRDIDVATDSDIPMENITAAGVAGLTARGWDMYIIGVDTRHAEAGHRIPGRTRQHSQMRRARSRPQSEVAR